MYRMKKKKKKEKKEDNKEKAPAQNMHFNKANFRLNM